MWICVGPLDPATKPSGGWLWVVVRKPRLVLVEIAAARKKSYGETKGLLPGVLRHRTNTRQVFFNRAVKAFLHHHENQYFRCTSK